MRKVGVIWYDSERHSWRVAMGKDQKTHIGRYATFKIAKRVLKAAIKAYKIGRESVTNGSTV